MRLIARFRPQRADGGSYPYHWVIDQLGAEVVAAARDERPPRRDHARLERRRWTSTRTLAHRLGVNQFFTDLAGTHPGAQLRRWLPESACQRPGAFTQFGDPALLLAYQPRIRPDGYGVWAEDGRVVPFFLEYDTGAETLSVLIAKLRGYRELFAELGRAWPVLYWLHSVAREHNLRAQLADLPALPVAVATGARDYATEGRHSPAESVWTAAGHPLRLATLAELNVLTVNVEASEL